MSEVLQQMRRGGGVLGGFALLSVALVAATYFGTRGRIAASEQAALEAQLNALVPAARYDNHPTEDTIRLSDAAAFGSGEAVTVYRARRAGEPVAALATVIAPDGYAGPIRLLVGVWADGRIAGVRVLAHKETPGLGDRIEIQRSDWIRSFDERSLTDPDAAGWKVRKDGGRFDQFTGATITPRAIVKAVHGFLEYAQAHRAELYAPASGDRVP
ncbi:MAG TPA: electron transport complex subunit RsxG [Plasticicumulans sp.]|nr:electron transport complex subunit RsxG [Plasticicumulans sp.]